MGEAIKVRLGVRVMLSYVISHQKMSTDILPLPFNSIVEPLKGGRHRDHRAGSLAFIVKLLARVKHADY